MLHSADLARRGKAMLPPLPIYSSCSAVFRTFLDTKLTGSSLLQRLLHTVRKSYHLTSEAKSVVGKSE